MAKRDIEGVEEEVLETSGPRVYELGFHIDPELPTEEVKKVYAALRSTIEEKAEIVAEGEPQMVQLAYTISRQETSGRRDFDTAQFSWIAYESSVENHAEILEAAKAERRVVRFIDLVTTKDAARHSAELRELALKTPASGDDQEASSPDAALDAALESAAV